ncbi:hypothetical protein ACNI3Q_07070 [Sphingomonas sp. FW199]|uniref:hypothetical protein n=1 Tax=Sphingomonas sp. FW199 TaxID=3400217 RepID=UPI003CEC64F4
MAQSKATPVKAQENKEGCQFALIIGVIVALIITVSQCDTKKPEITAEQPFGVASLTNQVEAIEPPATVAPLAPAQVTRGLRHLRLAYAAEGLSGAMIYSQSCYDGLSQEFEWAALDRCGAFDLQAVRTAEIAADQSLTSELEYFEPETAAARYLAVAIKAGETSENADLRLDALQKRVGDSAAPQTQVTPAGDEADVLGDEQEGMSKPVPTTDSPIDGDGGGSSHDDTIPAVRR